MTDNLTTRLRATAVQCYPASTRSESIITEAADRIEALEAVIAEALATLGLPYPGQSWDSHLNDANGAERALEARAILSRRSDSPNPYRKSEDA